MKIKNKTLLITGGTGSFGNAVLINYPNRIGKINYILNENIIFSSQDNTIILDIIES
jgi:FlaA1/EpsC-like NDP-sugar epimerase